MKKTPSLYLRDFSTPNADLTREVNPDCLWVVAGEGVATRKYDGTACRIVWSEETDDWVLYKRFDAKQGKTPPPGFEPADDPDPITGHWPGWIKVGAEPESKWHREALDCVLPNIMEGTFELCGPKIQGNPEDFDEHVLILHGVTKLYEVPTGFDELQSWLAERDIEGVVWHHPDGRMAKIKKKDFGLPRKVQG